MKRKERRSRKKPTGESGVLRIPPDAGEGPFRRVQFPDDKADIERFVLEGALVSGMPTLSERYGLTSRPVKNAESDFDFTLPTPSGKEYLDLVEFAPRADRSGPYRGARLEYAVDERVEDVVRTIQKKAAHYRGVDGAVHLLVYSTEHRLRLTSTVIDRVSLWSADYPHPFRSIYYYSPEGPQSGELLTIYPRSDIELETLRSGPATKRHVAIADFKSAEVSGEQQVVVKLGGLPQPGPGPVRLRFRGRIGPRREPG